ncbi:HXXEE domain-containing protein [Polaromonas sp.]|uniref:HXXEE domain-containing protein n=1 Tax=Polaromonas sp. TaxID=1869339 RepID=UPI003CB4636D
MSLSLLGWLFALGVVVHNVEEAWLLPAWSARAGRWHVRVTPAVFRFAVTVLSVAVLAAAWLASSGGPRSFGAYFIAGYALAMALNALVPHLVATLALRRYAPGTATGVLLNLPLGSWLVCRSLAEAYVDPAVFAVAGPATVFILLASIPLLFAVGRKLTGQPPEHIQDTR